ncbi:MAG: sortase [Chloroflexota bacterium]|nr:MAG: sortase [Chloroflexota bacterium]
MTIWKASQRDEFAQAARVESSIGFEDHHSTSSSPGNVSGSFRDEFLRRGNPNNGTDSPVSKDENTWSRNNIVRGRYQGRTKQLSQSSPRFEKMVIPSLKVNASIVAKSYDDLSWDLTNLGQDVAFLENVPNQKKTTNIIFAGHVTVRNGSHGPFRYLWKLNPGDEIILQSANLVYTYIVREQILVYPDDSYVLNDTLKPQLTLITCTTWDEATLSYLRRLVIFADLEKVETQTARFE